MTKIQFLMSLWNQKLGKKEEQYADTKDLSEVENQVPETTNTVHLLNQPTKPQESAEPQEPRVLDGAHSRLSVPTTDQSQTSSVAEALSATQVPQTANNTADSKDKSQQKFPTIGQPEDEPKQSETKEIALGTNNSRTDGIGSENPVSGDNSPGMPLFSTYNKPENESKEGRRGFMHCWNKVKQGLRNINVSNRNIRW